ncbi:BnaC06g30260D [Brassica napus]|uniref:BnaC06g30260D protein n=1 Tax=Brassica napus TaxID=3708 RepID=A0A078HPA1_BRANA|nr:BnaC06g30260D [Brassica napus]
MAWWSETMSYCGWNERHVRNAKGKVEARYYLERKDGGVDLAVVGRVKSSSKRMSFRYALMKNHSVLKKLGSLGSVEDVKGWLDSIVSGEMPHLADVPATTMTEQAAGGFNIRTSMSGKYQKPIHPTIDFSWMGSSWTCRKRRRHYPSFSRNGVKVSVNDFVYVLAEQNKRLVAYLEDLYEDSKGNKMVVVRWFHKTDEVGVVLSDETVDREIFFSLCLQDIKIECIDGLATVLSPQHYDKFLKLLMSVQLPPFFCQKIYGDDGLKPYDITQLQGYWRQEMLRYLNVSNFKSGEGAQALGTDPATGASLIGCVGIRSKRRRSADECIASPDSVDVDASNASMCKEEKDGYYIKKGSLVEVLSQDSGIRGCWLKALIVKKHKDKVKVQYQYIKDADDESKKLEEWILASRVADSDQLGLRTAGRKIVRPVLKPSNEINVCAVGVGMPVDVWWCDGWWEGIVVDKVSEEKFEVYLPGEKKMSSFHRSDLRQSMEWSADEWVHMNSRSDIVNSVLSLMREKEVEVKHDEKLSEIGVGVMSPKGEAKPTIFLPVSTSSKPSTKKPVPDLLKDVLCSSMGDSLFSSSVVGRRKRNRIVSCCPHKPSLTDGFSCEKPLDCENGKFMGDSVFGSSVGQPLTGLVMSR